MRDLLAAEWAKARSGRTWLIMATVAITLGLLASAGYATTAPDQIEAGLTDAEAVTDEMVRSWFTTLLLSALFGAVYVTKEFSSGSVGRSVLLSGGRTRLLLSKLVVGTGAGVLFGLLAAGSAAASPWLFLRDAGLGPAWTDDTWLTLLGVFTVTVMGAPWGVLLGWIVRSTAGAVGLLLLLTLLVDEALLRLVPSVGRFTMTIAMGSVYRDGKPELLSVPVAVLVISLWLAAAGALAHRLFGTRDLT